MYNKWHNRLREEEDSKTKSSSEKEHITPQNSPAPYNEEEMEKLRVWLCNYTEPLTEIVEKWQNTVEYRKNMLKSPVVQEISQMFNKWPLYKSTHGHILIGIDFKHIFPNVQENLLSRWTHFKSKMKNIFQTDIKDAKFCAEWKDFRKSICNEGIS